MSTAEPRLRLLRAPNLDARLARRIQRRVSASDWVALALETLDRGRGADALREEPDSESLLQPGFEFAVVLDPRRRAAVLRQLPCLVPAVRRLRPELLVLARGTRTPDVDEKSNRKVTAFGCTPAWLASVLEAHTTAPLVQLPYNGCRAAWSDADLRPRILVREFGSRRMPGARLARRLRGNRGTKHPTPEPPLPSARIVIPHRGELGTLERLLAALAECRSDGLRICVGFDEPIHEAHRRLATEHPDAAFYAVTPDGVGPYVLRHFLAMQAREDLVIFQDSDDLPTLDRFDALRREMLRSSADVIGSQEIRIEESRKQVRCVRYALDVNRALSMPRRRPQLHPTTAVRTAGLQKSGGLSTVRRFASDHEFLLRYVQTMRGENLPGTLYLRLKMETGLTRRADTGMQSQARRELHERWDRDLDLIRSGRKTVEETSLAVQHADTTFQFTDLRSGERTSVRFSREAPPPALRTPTAM